MRPLAEHGQPQNFKCQCKTEATTIKKERERWKIARLDTFYPLSRSANKIRNYGNLYRMRVCVRCMSLGPFRLLVFHVFCRSSGAFSQYFRWQPREVNIKTQVKQQQKNPKKMEHVCWTHRVLLNEMEISAHKHITNSSEFISQNTIVGRRRPNGNMRFVFGNLIGSKRFCFARLCILHKKKSAFFPAVVPSAFVFILFLLFTFLYLPTLRRIEGWLQTR